MSGPKDIRSVSEYDAALKSTSQLVVINFGATWCGPCKAIAPRYAAIAARYAGQASFYRCDIDAVPGAWERQRAKGVPTFSFYAKGVLVDQFSGADEQRLESTIKRLAPKYKAYDFGGGKGYSLKPNEKTPESASAATAPTASAAAPKATAAPKASAAATATASPTAAAAAADDEHDHKNSAAASNTSAEECAICLSAPVRPVVSDCSHTFCEKCIVQALSGKPACPLCRNDIRFVAAAGYHKCDKCEGKCDGKFVRFKAGKQQLVLAVDEGVLGTPKSFGSFAERFSIPVDRFKLLNRGRLHRSAADLNTTLARSPDAEFTVIGLSGAAAALPDEDAGPSALTRAYTAATSSGGIVGAFWTALDVVKLFVTTLVSPYQTPEQQMATYRAQQQQSHNQNRWGGGGGGAGGGGGGGAGGGSGGRRGGYGPAPSAHGPPRAFMMGGG